MIEAIEVNSEVFDPLRSAMRIVEVGTSAGLNSGGDPVSLGPIAQAVTQFRKTMTSRSDYSSNKGWKALIAQIDIDAVRRELTAARTSLDRVPPAIRQLIQVPAFPESLSALFRKAA